MTKSYKLQHTRQNKQKRERLERTREQIFNAIHLTFAQTRKKGEKTDDSIDKTV